LYGCESIGCNLIEIDAALCGGGSLIVRRQLSSKSVPAMLLGLVQKFTNVVAPPLF
jgi:hypothetical protein